MRKLSAVLASVVLAAGMAACGGDDDEAGGGGGDDQDEAADMFIDQAKAAGIEPDEDCVHDKADQLSDADAKAIIDAGDSGSPQLSPEGEALTIELAQCVSNDEMIDLVLSDLPEGIDEDCVRDALEGVEMAGLAEGETPPEFIAAMTECVTGG